MGKMTYGEKWLCEVRTIHYIDVLPIGTFPGGEGENSLTGTTRHDMIEILATGVWRTTKQLFGLRGQYCSNPRELFNLRKTLGITVYDTQSKSVCGTVE